MNINRAYKSSVFTLLFGEEQAFRELYEAIKGIKLPPDTSIVLNTLEGALFRERMNDLSGLVGRKEIVIMEHQSTINPNMALRLLSYIARLYEKINAGKNSLLYGKKELRIPAPEIIVLYNGTDQYPEYKELRLSDLFEDVSVLGVAKKFQPDLELIAHVYNINIGYNEALLKKDAALNGYAVFIAKVREFEAELLGGMTPKELPKEELDAIKKAAMEKAVKWCVTQNILKEFLETNSSEVINMLFDEWKLEEALVVEREEGIEEGIEIGIEKGCEKREKEVAENLSDFGMPPEQISKALKLPVDTVIRYLGNTR